LKRNIIDIKKKKRNTTGCVMLELKKKKVNKEARNTVAVANCRSDTPLEQPWAGTGEKPIH